MPKVSFKTIDSNDVSGKRVLVRVDLNVPMKNGQGDRRNAHRARRADAHRTAAKGAKVIVLSHFGRPDGKRVPEMSLKPLVEPLSKALGKPVAFAEDCIGPLAKTPCAR
jgi:3-phosphoglycerate kinase